MNETRLDSASLSRIISSVANNNTGVGTQRDKTRSGVSINASYTLHEWEIQELYRGSGLIQNIVTAYPEDCELAWLKTKTPDFPDSAIAIEEYLKQIEFSGDFDSIQSAFARASILGRLYGDGFIVMGIADGKDPSEPVELGAIQSIEWLKVFDRYEVHPEYVGNGDRLSPEHYRIYRSGKLDDLRWHKSRVLRFPGTRLYSDRYLTNEGHNDSVLQGVINSYLSWNLSVMAGSGMIQDYSQMVYGIKGLGKKLGQDMVSGNDNNEQQIKKRLSTAEMGRSWLKALIIDLEEEKAEYIHRNFSGVDAIINVQERSFLSNVDLPAYKIFNQSNSSGQSMGNGTNAALIQQFDWCDRKNTWMQVNWVRPYTTLCRYIAAAKNSKLGGVDKLGRLEIKPAAQVTLNPQQNAEIQSVMADIHQRMLSMNAYGVATVQQNFLEPTEDGKIQIAEADLFTIAPSEDDDE
jgi:phage-related protein (TIGR01555 family)